MAGLQLYHVFNEVIDFTLGSDGGFYHKTLDDVGFVVANQAELRYRGP